MLAGFEEATSGQIMLDGQDITAVPPYRRPVNMMFQSYALFPHMTVEANVAFGLKQEGVDRAEIHDRVRSEEHTSELQSLMRISYAVFCLKKKTSKQLKQQIHNVKTT